jgi:hypothetical protein
MGLDFSRSQWWRGSFGMPPVSTMMAEARHKVRNRPAKSTRSCARPVYQPSRSIRIR